MGIKEKMSSLLALPKEIVLNLPQVIITGHGEVVVENYRNLIEFTDALVRLNTNSGILRVEGSRLYLKQITSESVTIIGEIFTLQFIR